MASLRPWWRKLRAALAKRLGVGRGPASSGSGAAPPGSRAASLPAPAAHRLIAALEHPNPDVRAGAAHQLARFADNPGVGGSDGARGIVTALTEALADDDASVRSAAALSLGEWGASASGAIPALIQALAEEDDDVRSSAGIALQDIGRASREPLQQALSHPDPRVQAEAEAILALMPEKPPSSTQFL